MLKNWLERYKIYILGGGACVGFFIIMGLLFISQPQKKESESFFEEEAVSRSSEASKEAVATSELEVYVDVKGAVNKPGMYETKINMRVWDVVQLAGGVQENADTRQVNFSQRIADQMVIYIPIVGEVFIEESLEANADEHQVEEKASDKIDLNKASETELQTLTGIGPKKATEIIRYREENGGFKAIEDLKNISGISEKTIEKIKEQITVS